MMSSSVIHTLLGLAGGLPLHISFRRSNHLLECITPHMDRVRSLKVTLEVHTAEDFTSRGIFFQPAPLLEALHISSDDDGKQHIDVPTLFSDCAPKLSRLFLSQHAICATNRFPALTHLYLRAQYTHAPESLNHLLDFLDGSPMLEDVVFETAGPCMLPELLDVFPLTRAVTLRRLRSLVFSECHWAVPACILRHVVPGAHVKIKINELLELAHSSELSHIFAQGAAFLRHLDNPTQLTLWCLYRRFCIRYATASASVTLDITFHYTLLTVPMQGTLVSTLLVELPNVLSLAGVTNFGMRVERAAHIWAPAVRALHSALPAVEVYTLWLDPDLNKSYWRATLASKLHEPVFVRLRALHIVGALPSVWRSYWVMGLAISRAKHGRPLDALTFAVVSACSCIPLAMWDPEKVHIGGQRVADFVKGLQFRWLTPGVSCISVPEIKGWDGEVVV